MEKSIWNEWLGKLFNIDLNIYNKSICLWNVCCLFKSKWQFLCDFFLSHILFCNRCTLNDCSTQWHSMCLNAEKMYLFRIVINWIVVVVGNIQLLERFEMFVLFVSLVGQMANEAMILRSKWIKSQWNLYKYAKKPLRMVHWGMCSFVKNFADGCKSQPLW